MLNNKGFAITSIIYAILILFLVLVLGLLSVLGTRKMTFDKLKKDVSEKLNSVETVVLYNDGSGANNPALLNEMVPIYYTDKDSDGTSEWVYANIYEDVWYDYNVKKWANAVVLNVDNKQPGDTISESEIDLWYVWIPRYKYTIFNTTYDSQGLDPVQINITFESGTESTGTVTCTDNISTSGSSSETCSDKNGSITATSTYTHPAFTFGDQELEGIWVGKFENSGSTSAITIKPNVAPIVSQTVSSFYTANQGISTTYGITDGDSHMMKNMEWGAVAYMKQSQYGLGITDVAVNNYYNSSSSVYYLTGCGSEIGTTTTTTTCTKYNETNGLKASSTGNIYGVYDMSGGVFEYVMGNISDPSTAEALYPSQGGTFTNVDAKYYDMYTYNTDYSTHARGKLGDATKETLVTFGNTSGGWYSDYASFPSLTASWFSRSLDARSGVGTGAFSFGRDTGTDYGYYGSRSVLVPTQ